jgi:ABC-type uncharacterized transport system, permease and ATPase components
LDTTAEWPEVLSVGEAQRLSFARVFAQQPPLVLLDEATSAVDVETERRLYKALGARVSTYVSIGHRLPSLQMVHTDALKNTRPGEWEHESLK